MTVALLGATVTPLIASHVNASGTPAHAKVGLAIIGGVNDKGFNALANRGLVEAENNLGVTGRVIVVPQNGNYNAALQQFVNAHYDLVIAVGALWGGALYDIAKANRSTHFAIVDGYAMKGNTPVLMKNVATLQFKSEQSGYLAGTVAGLMEKNKVGAATHNVIGAVGAIPLPFIIADACGYMEGAQSVDSSVKVVFGYVGGFFDTQTAQQIGQTQIQKDNADILFGIADASGLGYYKAAAEAHKYAIGFAADQDGLGNYMLTSGEIGIQVAVYRTIKAEAAGKFKPYGHQFSVKNGGISYAKDMHHVPASIKAKVAKVASKLAAGTVVVKPTCKLPTS